MSDRLQAARQRVRRKIEEMGPALRELALFIHSHPELGYEEMQAADALVRLLTEEGFSVERPVAGLKTAFAARSGPGPVSIGYCCEYDALPGIGHACGHNLIAIASAGAGIALASVAGEIGGRAVVYGCPAEEGAVEGAGGKVHLLEAGLLDEVTAAMMVHPSSMTVVNTTSTAREALEITFFGKSAHAAQAASEGINALEALLQFLAAINSLRSRLGDGDQVHGIITDGGRAPNIIPDRAQARLYVRGKTARRLEQLVDMVKKCAEGIAQAMSARVECRQFAKRYLDTITNVALAERLADHLDETGLIADRGLSSGTGSTDMGNVSHVVPSVHAYVAIPCDGVSSHSAEFAAACGGERAVKVATAAALAMALTGVDVILDQDLRHRIEREFAERVN